MIYTGTPASRALARCVCADGAVLRIGGDSSSSTAQNTTNKNFNTAGGNDSTNINADGSTIFATDNGAVAGALQLGTHAVDAAVVNSEDVQNTTRDLYSGALSFATAANKQALQAVSDSGAQVADAFSQAASQLATAYTDSKTPDKSILMVGGVIVVGLVGVMLMARKG